MPRFLTYKKLDKKIKRIEKKVELKYIDSAADITQIEGAALLDGLTPFALNLTTIYSGNGAFNRIGRRVWATSLRLNMSINGDYSDEAVQDDWNYYRIIVVKWKQPIPDPNAAMPMLFTAPRNSGTLLSNSQDLNHLAFYNLDYKNQYKVLYDSAGFLVGTAGGEITTEKFQKLYNLKIPLNYEISYPENSLNPEYGGLVVYAFSDSTVAPHPQIRVLGRLYYKDA